jgi:hypothetical protein
MTSFQHVIQAIAASGRRGGATLELWFVYNLIHGELDGLLDQKWPPSLARSSTRSRRRSTKRCPCLGYRSTTSKTSSTSGTLLLLLLRWAWKARSKCNPRQLCLMGQSRCPCPGLRRRLMSSAQVIVASFEIKISIPQRAYLLWSKMILAKLTKQCTKLPLITSEVKRVCVKSNK